MVVRLLARGQFLARRRRYLLLAGVFAVGLLGFFAMVSVVDGTREAITAPLAATISGDLRVTRGTSDLGASRALLDPYGLAAAVERAANGHVSVRLETSFLTVRGEDLEDWSAGLLIGIDPKDAAEADRLRPYLVWGEPVRSRDVFDPDSGKAYTPLVVGKPTVERLNVTLPQDGRPDFSAPLTLTSGRLQAGRGSLPIVDEGVVVGVFDTGLQPLDKFTAFVPIEAARVLAGHHEGDPIANTLVFTGGDVDAAERIVYGADAETRTRTAQEFAFDYIGGVLGLAYFAGGLALAVFLAVLVVWLVHEIGVLLRSDGAIVSSLRAIGIPTRAVLGAYTVLLVGCVLAGAVAAAVLTLLLAAFAPPVTVVTGEARLAIPWALRPLGTLLVAAVVVLASFVAVWATGRRLSRMNILDGLRGA